ncbi:MAG: universal stress protein [Pseudomonadota bacterium]
MYQQILVPIDGSATAQRGLQEAIRVATLTGGRLRLIHVVDELTYTATWEASNVHRGDWRELAQASGARLLQLAGDAAIDAHLGVETVLKDISEGSTAELIASEARQWQADLIVLGTHGRRGIGRMLMGSCAEQVLRCASCPVLLVRAPEEAAKPPAVLSRKHVSLPSGALAIE